MGSLESSSLMTLIRRSREEIVRKVKRSDDMGVVLMVGYILVFKILEHLIIKQRK